MADLPRQLSRQALGGPRLSREALGAYQRERFLDAALGVFAKRGYQQTTVDNIVAASGTSVGGFYQHFDSREDCFLALFDRIVASVREGMGAAASAEEDWAAQTYAGLATMLAAVVAEPLAARVVLIEAQSAGRAATARYRSLGDVAAEWLRAGRRHHAAAAELPGTFEQAAVGGTAYFLHQRLLSGESLDLGGLLEETSQIVLGPIVGPDALRRLGTAVATAS